MNNTEQLIELESSDFKPSFHTRKTKQKGNKRKCRAMIAQNKMIISIGLVLLFAVVLVHILLMNKRNVLLMQESKLASEEAERQKYYNEVKEKKEQTAKEVKDIEFQINKLKKETESLNKEIDNLVSQRRSLVERRKSLQDSIMDYEAQNSKLMMQLDMGGII